MRNYNDTFSTEKELFSEQYLLLWFKRDYGLFYCYGFKEPIENLLAEEVLRQMAYILPPSFRNALKKKTKKMLFLEKKLASFFHDMEWWFEKHIVNEHDCQKIAAFLLYTFLKQLHPECLISSFEKHDVETVRKTTRHFLR